MPSGKNPTTSIKLAGNISKVGKINKKNIDPYSQLMVALHSKTPFEIEKLTIVSQIEFEENNNKRILKKFIVPMKRKESSFIFMAMD